MPTHSPIVPAPVVTVLGVPMPSSSRGGGGLGEVSPQHTVDVGIMVPTGAGAAKSSAVRDRFSGAEPNATMLGMPAYFGTESSAAAAGPSPGGSEPRLVEAVATMGRLAQSERETPLPGPQRHHEPVVAYEGYVVPRESRNHETGDGDLRGGDRAPLQLRAPSDSPVRVPRANKATADVSVLFYRLDAEVLGPSSSSQPLAGPLSSKPPSYSRPQSYAPKSRSRWWIWGVLLLISVGAATGVARYLQRTEGSRKLPSSSKSLEIGQGRPVVLFSCGSRHAVAT